MSPIERVPVTIYPASPINTLEPQESENSESGYLGLDYPEIDYLTSIQGVSYTSSSRIGGGGYQSRAAVKRAWNTLAARKSRARKMHPPHPQVMEAADLSQKRLPDLYLTVEESTNIENYPEYQYHPATLYEAQVLPDDLELRRKAQTPIKRERQRQTRQSKRINIGLSKLILRRNLT